MERRALLAALGTGVSATVAGCTGDGSNDENETNETGSTDTNETSGPGNETDTNETSGPGNETDTNETGGDETNEPGNGTGAVAPSVSFEFSQDPQNETLEVTHAGGDSFEASRVTFTGTVDQDGRTWAAVQDGGGNEVTATESVTLTGAGEGYSVELRWRPEPGEDASILDTSEGSGDTSDPEPGRVDSLALSLAEPTVETGETTTATVTATLADGTTETVTGAATLTSRARGVATVEGASVTGETAGRAAVEATYRGQRATATLSVVGVQSVTLSLARSRLDIGQTTRATVTAAYTDGTTEEVTERATIEGDGTVAVADGARITGEVAGEATVTTSFAGQTATADLTVVGVDSLALSLAEQSVETGATTGATVTATFTDGTSSEVTDAATLASRAPAVAAVDGATVTGETAGQATVEATYRGQRATARVRVVGVDSLAVSTASQRLRVGEATRVSVTAAFTDGTSEEVTRAATLDTGDTASVQSRRVVGETAGQATVQATYRGQQASTELTVVGIESVSVSLARSEIRTGETTTATVTVIFTDGATRTVTDLATLATESGTASVSGARVTGETAGQATVVASFADREATTGLTVTTPPAEVARQYLDDNRANNYDGRIVDATGRRSVTVDVGAEGGSGNFAFGPAAIRVSPGTTVTWEWTGNGGFHNVESAEVPAGGQSLDSGRPVGERGTTYSETLETTGAYRYFCGPHQSIGMHGAVVVADD